MDTIEANKQLRINIHNKFQIPKTDKQKEYETKQKIGLETKEANKIKEEIIKQYCYDIDKRINEKLASIAETGDADPDSYISFDFDYSRIKYSPLWNDFDEKSIQDRLRETDYFFGEDDINRFTRHDVVHVLKYFQQQGYRLSYEYKYNRDPIIIRDVENPIKECPTTRPERSFFDRPPVILYRLHYVTNYN